MEKQITIQGIVPSESNNYRISPRGNITRERLVAAFNRGGIGRVIGLFRLKPTEKVKSYERAFALQCKTNHIPIGDFDAEIKVYYPSKRADVDNSLKTILDLLQKCNVIENDRKMRRLTLERAIDKKEPRCEIKITEITSYK